MNKRYPLDNIEEVISETEELIEVEDSIVSINSDSQIIVSSWSWIWIRLLYMRKTETQKWLYCEVLG